MSPCRRMIVCDTNGLIFTCDRSDPLSDPEKREGPAVIAGRPVVWPGRESRRTDGRCPGTCGPLACGCAQPDYGHAQLSRLPGCVHRQSGMTTANAHPATAPSPRMQPTCRTRPFAIHADWRRPRLEGRCAAGAVTGTINRETSALHRMGTLAVHWGWLDTVPGFPDRLRENSPRQGFFLEPSAGSAVVDGVLDEVTRTASTGGWRVQESSCLPSGLLHESSRARTMPTDRILTCRCDTTLVGRGRSSD